jgi:hypothetical protein
VIIFISQVPNMLFTLYAIRIYDMQVYITNQVTNFNLHAGHARTIDITQY